jgi:hypothetical protein
MERLEEQGYLWRMRNNPTAYDAYIDPTEDEEYENGFCLALLQGKRIEYAGYDFYNDERHSYGPIISFEDFFADEPSTGTGIEF